MASSETNISAGLEVTKDDASPPTSGISTTYISAGLTPTILAGDAEVYPLELYNKRNMTPLLQM